MRQKRSIVLSLLGIILITPGLYAWWNPFKKATPIAPGNVSLCIRNDLSETVHVDIPSYQTVPSDIIRDANGVPIRSDPRPTKIHFDIDPGENKCIKGGIVPDSYYVVQIGASPRDTSDTSQFELLIMSEAERGRILGDQLMPRRGEGQDIGSEIGAFKDQFIHGYALAIRKTNNQIHLDPIALPEKGISFAHTKAIKVTSK